jgi:NAD(P)H dehydrogenase (quinone)
MSRRALILYAHPEPRSFCAALRDVACAALAEAGYAVGVSDLYAQRFKAVLEPEDYGVLSAQQAAGEAAPFNVTLAQRRAVKEGSLAPDIARELEKLLACDLLVLVFPLWWFGMPAILKGWFDRVLLSGTVYGRSALFENGKLRGKKALVATTTGGPAEFYGAHSLNGDLLDILMPLHRGVLAFTGMTVLPPYVATHVPYAGEAARTRMLEEFAAHLRRLDELTPLPMPRVADHLHQMGHLLKAKAE